MASSRLHPLSSLSPQLLLDLKEATNQRLENALRAISTSRYASSVPALEEFRLAIKDKNIQDTLSDFRELVPLTDHEAYRPWMNKFFERPCKLSEVENLFAPGLPSFLGASSSTTGGEPKHFARYLGSTGPSGPVACSVGSASLKGTSMIVYSLRYRDRVDITSDSGEVVKSIPACVVSSGVMRVSEAWSIETDSSRMASIGEHRLNHIVNFPSLNRYLYSSWPCRSMGNGFHKSLSVLSVDTCTLFVGQPELGANCYVNPPIFHRYVVLH